MLFFHDDTRFKLFYYTWPKDEKHNYEIDFLLSRGAKIDPNWSPGITPKHPYKFAAVTSDEVAPKI